MLVRATHDERINSVGNRYYDAILLYDPGSGKTEKVVLARGFTSRTGAQREADNALLHIRRAVEMYIKRKRQP